MPLIRGFGHVADFAHADGCLSILAGAVHKVAVPEMRYLDRGFLPIEDQEESSSCVGFAVGAAVEYLSGANQRVSKLAIYTASRALERPAPGVLTDNGCMPLSALAAITANESALVADKLWPFKAKHVNKRLPLDIYQSAEGSTVDYYRIGDASARSSLVKHAIGQGFPVVFAMKIRDEYVSGPDYYRAESTDRTVVGSHMQAITGYDREWFRVRNSWGIEWANRGYTDIHRSVIDSDDCLDFYAITRARTVL